ncbi:MAG: hypothetical protein LBJ63_04140 [Prevotellaceae bacterium]|jgi:hypothetical protein|nr:hypothetical protein [Prevotellaceae bacterium]
MKSIIISVILLIASISTAFAQNAVDIDECGCLEKHAKIAGVSIETFYVGYEQNMYNIDNNMKDFMECLKNCKQEPKKSSPQSATTIPHGGTVVGKSTKRTVYVDGRTPIVVDENIAGIANSAPSSPAANTKTAGSSTTQGKGNDKRPANPPKVGQLRSNKQSNPQRNNEYWKQRRMETERKNKENWALADAIAHAIVDPMIADAVHSALSQRGVQMDVYVYEIIAREIRNLEESETDNPDTKQEKVKIRNRPIKLLGANGTDAGNTTLTEDETQINTLRTSTMVTTDPSNNSNIVHTLPNIDNQQNENTVNNLNDRHVTEQRSAVSEQAEAVTENSGQNNSYSQPNNQHIDGNSQLSANTEYRTPLVTNSEHLTFNEIINDPKAREVIDNTPDGGVLYVVEVKEERKYFESKDINGNGIQNTGEIYVVMSEDRERSFCCFSEDDAITKKRNCLLKTQKRRLIINYQNYRRKIKM